MVRGHKKDGERVYTAREVGRLRDHLIRAHLRDRADYGQQRYAEGVAAGRRAVVNALRDLLEIGDCR